LRTIKGMEDRTPSKVEGAIEWLNQDPYLLATITAIPGVGGSITQVITGIGQQIVQERNARLFKQLSEHLADIDEQSIRRDYFETPEGFDLLIKAMDESRRTRSDEKRDLIARILRGAAVESEDSNYSPEEYLYLISDLTVQELRIARTVYKDRPVSTLEAWQAWEEEMCESTAIDEASLHMALRRLTSLGLLLEIHAFDGTVSYFRPTTSFDRLMEFLQLGT
jgi:hypothetical protein